MARTKRAPLQVRRRTRLGSHHDGLFQLAFSVPKHAASELKNLLSKEIVARIKWDKLRNVSGKFTDAKLTNRFSDILFEVEIDDEKAFVHILFEHKSSPDRWTLLQILDYEVRIWREYLRKNPHAQQLPLILPVVVHHGPSGWTVPREFIEYFADVPEELRRYVPNFGVVIDDVGKVSPEKLLGRPLTPEAKLVLLCLLLGRTPEKFLDTLRQHPAALKGTWKGTDRVVVIEGVVVYLENISGISQDETIMALQNLLNLSPAEEIMYAHEIRSRRAREEGRQEGELEGELKAIRMLVTKQLTERFGKLAPDATARLQAATKTELEEMALRVLRVSTLDEVLGKSKRKRK